MRLKSFRFLVALAALFLQAGIGWATTCGDAYYNHNIDWPSTSPLYFSVAGAPPNTCGDLYANRNGSGYVLNAAGWICTDSFGNATKGPWSSNPDDEVALSYIDWGSCNSPEVWHIWDVDPPSVDIQSACFSSFFCGDATDDPWGVGFDDDWDIECRAQFYNYTTGNYWCGSGYVSPTSCYIDTTLFGVPDTTISWCANSVPPSSAHQSGHCYLWSAQCKDHELWGDPDVKVCCF